MKPSECLAMCLSITVFAVAIFVNFGCVNKMEQSGSPEKRYTVIDSHGERYTGMKYVSQYLETSEYKDQEGKVYRFAGNHTVIEE